MIPPELTKIRVTLVERQGFPGKLGVAVRGGKFVCPLPDGYDGHTRVNVDQAGWVLVTHPKLPPLLCDPTTGATNPITVAVDPKVFTKPKAIH